MSSIVFPGGVGTPTFDEAAHAYTFEGKSVPSVTQVMRPITQLAYGAIPLEVLRKAAAFGTAVHACTELYDQDDLDPFSVEDDWLPYMAGWEGFRKDRKPEIIAIELRLACSKYAGTIDRIMRIDGELWVIDIKTTCELHAHVGVQLAAYAALAEKHLGTKERIRRGAVQLRDDGGYRLREYTHLNDETCFAGLLGIFYWGQSHGFNKE